MHKKWAKIQSILEKKISPGHFKVWIAPLTVSSEESGLTLHAQSAFAAEFIETRLLPLIKDAAREVCGTTLPIRVNGDDPRATGAQTQNVSRLLLLSDDRREQTGPRIPLASGTGMHHSTSNSPVTFGAGSATMNASSAPLGCSTDMKNTIVTSTAPSPRPLPEPRPLPQMQFALPVEQTTQSRQLPEPGWRFSFDDFVVGPCNELAYAASRSMCDDLLHADILYLSSAPGLGKTHLMQAVGKALCSCCNRRSMKVEYLTAEELTTQFFQALKSQSMDRFKARFRTADLFLLEDVHFMQGKEKMQSELLATVNALSERGSKVVFTSSFIPKDLKSLDNQLQSRLSAGLLAVIDRPDEALRRKILRHKAATHQVVLPDEVEDALAKYINKDVRQIESCLQNLILKARLLNTNISLKMAFEVMSHYAQCHPVLDMESILLFVCKAFRINREQLFSACRKQEFVQARNTAFFLARKHTDLSLEAIGRQFNRRHSTVLKGITSLEREISRQSPLGRQLANTLSLIERNGNVLG